jgi:glyoxylase-like metal-dependent hydrolase (beta-lactamase superfamily II)
MKRLVFVLIASAAVTFCVAQQKAASLTLTPLQGNVYFLDGGLGNMTVLVDANELLVVDTKAKEAGDSLEHFLMRDLKGKKVSYIINTHMHWDHTGNNERIGKDAVIIAHVNSRRSLKGDSAKISPGWPEVTFDSEMSIHFAGDEVRLIHFPKSHTDHDLVAWFTRSKVLAMGDMYFSGMYPYIADDGDLKGLITSLGKIIAMMPPDIRIVPGHGPVSTLKDLKATHTMLIETSAFIERQIAAGKSLEEIKKEGLGKWTPVWGKGFCKEACWIETLYQYLKK